MNRLEKLKQELEIAKAMKAELNETIKLDIDEDGKLESKRLYKFLRKTTEKVNDLIEIRLEKLNEIILSIYNEIKAEQMKQRSEALDSILEKIESQQGTENTSTEFEKMIEDIFGKIPLDVKFVRIPRD